MKANNGVISQLSPYSVTENIDRLVTVLEAKNLQQRFSLSDELVENIDVTAPLIHQALLLTTMQMPFPGI